MRRDTNRPHSRTAAAVRNAKGFVQIDVADVSTNVSRSAKPDERIHICAIHVHLPAVLVNDFANVFDRRLEDTMSRRVRDHERR